MKAKQPKKIRHREPTPPPEVPPPTVELPPELITLTLTADELGLIVDALDSHMYWQLADAINRNDGAVIDEEESDELKECKALHDTLEDLSLKQKLKLKIE